MNQARSKADATSRAYEDLVALIDPLMDLVPGGMDIELHASAPEGVPEPQRLPPRAAAFVRESVLPALTALDALLTLERAPDGGVWETLVLDGRVNSGKAWLVVANAIGEHEHVKTFGTGPGQGRYMAEWSRARSETEDLGTSWDVARRERRVVQYMGEATLVEPGLNRLVDILATLGRKPIGSCEGHPGGAYVAFEPMADADLEEAFATSGWSLDNGGRFAHMPKVGTTSDRDTAWRALCSDLEMRYGLEGPDDAVGASPTAGP